MGAGKARTVKIPESQFTAPRRSLPREVQAGDYDVSVEDDISCTGRARPRPGTLPPARDTSIGTDAPLPNSLFRLSVAGVVVSTRTPRCSGATAIPKELEHPGQVPAASSPRPPGRPSPAAARRKIVLVVRSHESMNTLVSESMYQDSASFPAPLSSVSGADAGNAGAHPS